MLDLTQRRTWKIAFWFTALCAAAGLLLAQVTDGQAATKPKESPGFLRRSEMEERWLGANVTLIADAMIGYIPETESRVWSVNRVNKEGKVDGAWCAHEVRAKGEPFLQTGDPVHMTMVSYGLTGGDQKTIYFVSRK